MVRTAGVVISKCGALKMVGFFPKDGEMVNQLPEQPDFAQPA